jgi:hypothetical protein
MGFCRYEEPHDPVVLCFRQPCHIPCDFLCLLISFENVNMMYKETRIFHLLVDASGSMEEVAEEVIETCNARITSVREFAAGSPDIKFTMGLSLFRGSVETIYAGMPPDEANFLTREQFRPDGNTALFDAMDAVLTVLENEWMHTVSLMPARVDLYIITDGYDSASSVTRFADLRERFRSLAETGAWHFHFEGADLDAIEMKALLAFRKKLKDDAHPEGQRSALVDFLTPTRTGQVHGSQATDPMSKQDP